MDVPASGSSEASETGLPSRLAYCGGDRGRRPGTAPSHRFYRKKKEQAQFLYAAQKKTDCQREEKSPPDKPENQKESVKNKEKVVKSLD